MKKVMSTQVNMKRCVKCDSLFSTPFFERTLCVLCKPTTRKELDRLMNYEGGHVVNVKGQVQSLVA